MVSKPIVHNTLTVSEENYSESYKKNKENSKTPQDSKKLQHPVNLLSSQHYYNILNSLNISFNDLGGFTSKLTILCPAISQPIRFSLSPIVISLLLLEKFKNFPLIQETVYINFFNIKRLILQFDSSKYEIIYNQTLSLFLISILSQNIEIHNCTNKFTSSTGSQTQVNWRSKLHHKINTLFHKEAESNPKGAL